MYFPNIDPVMIHLGSLEIRWYAVMYIIAFIIGNIFIKKLYKNRNIDISHENYENFMFYIMLGVILGGRFGYVLFYNLPYYLHHPLEIILPFRWDENGFRMTGISGMSFHGGALGVIISALIFCKKYKYNFYELADPAMPFVAIGLGLGRIGNFINAELYGRVTTVPWAMRFPYYDHLGNLAYTQPRHPSQLYEAFLEGFLMCIILSILVKKRLANGTVFWSFIGLYGIFRFVVEYFREPDEHLKFIFVHFTMGQILSSAMILSALIFIIRKWQKSFSNS